jgi:muramoyltetrapeptide carboxypeptidase
MTLPCPFPPEIRTIGVFAPAGVPAPERLERGLARLRDWGLEVVYPGHDDPRERFLAGPDALRLQRLHELLADPKVDLLLAARGGYGCARLLDGLDWDLFVARDLPLVGYSDLTALHAAAFGHGYRRGVFGPMVAGDLGRIPADGEGVTALTGVYDSLRMALCGQPQTFSGLTCLRPGQDTGPLVPANLSVLASLAGTRHFPDFAGTILVLEDIGEAAYRVDRYLHQLDQAGVLGKLAGLVFAQFSETEDAEWLPGVLADFATRMPGPVASGLEFGHAFPSFSLPVGARFSLSVDESLGHLQFVP